MTSIRCVEITSTSMVVALQLHLSRSASAIHARQAERRLHRLDAAPMARPHLPASAGNAPASLRPGHLALDLDHVFARAQLDVVAQPHDGHDNAGSSAHCRRIITTRSKVAALRCIHQRYQAVSNSISIRSTCSSDVTLSGLPGSSRFRQVLLLAACAFLALWT